jgi:cell wall-associated NlpC family hydrolase
MMELTPAALRMQGMAGAGLLVLPLLLGGCAGTGPPAAPPAARAPRERVAVPVPQPSPHGVIGVALSLDGAPYRNGGDTPATGFDCSGFVHYVYLTQGIELPRTTAAMARTLPRVRVQDMRPGDLVFFNTSGRPHSHVGLYLGGERFIHAPSRRTGHVRISDLRLPYWHKRFDGVRRPHETSGIARRD